MKTVLSALALALVSSVASAMPTASTSMADFVWIATGDGPEMQYITPLLRTRAEVNAETKAAIRLPSYTDGSAYEAAVTMFMSRLSRDSVRAEAVAAARTNRNLAGLDTYGGGR